MADIAFEYFDPELELGNLDINGKPIKPRKKPGRKPNPPSPAQRKAQNRAAQRAFRERKRQEIRESETNIKKCLHMRDQAIKDAKALQKKNEELVFENNYLKGQLLSLKFACLYNRVDVPKFWDTGLRDRIGSEKMTFSRGKEIPQPLEFFLDKERLIFSISPEELKQNMTEKTPSQPHHTTSPSTQHTSSPPNSTSYNMHEPALSPTSTMSSIQPEHPSPFSVQDLNPDMMQFLLQPDLLEGIINTVKDLPPDLWMQFIPPELSAMVPPEMFTHIIQSAEAQKNKMDYDVPSMNQTSPLPQQQSVAPQKGPQADPDFWLDTNNPLTNDSKVFVPGPMSPYDAVNHLRSLRNENDNFLFTPTELQRKIPHDPRIDVVPGGTMRDFMILFQDFYDPNELFNFLLDEAVFIGGELGNPDCWFVPPHFIRKYWFLCPNHRPTRPDNSVELAYFIGDRMMEALNVRKEMYIDRENHADAFPQYARSERSALDDNGNVRKGKSDKLKEERKDVFVVHVAKQSLRLTSPNAFTI